MFLLNATHDHIERVAVWSDNANQEDFFSVDFCWELRRNQTHFVSDPKKDLICKHMQINTTIRCYTCLPLMAQGEILGLLTMELTQDLFNEAQRLLAVATAEQVVLALANAKLRESLHQ